MWTQKDALILVEKYFRDDEKEVLMQRLPWYYAFTKVFVCMLSVFVLSAGIVYRFRKPMEPGILLAYLIIGSFILHYIVTRSIFPNYVVVSQYSVYRYIKKSIDRADELKWSDVQSVSVKIWRIGHKLATVTILGKSAYIKQLPFLKRQITIRGAQKNPIGLSFRDLSLSKPISFRFVIANFDEWIQVLQDLQSVSENKYKVSVKGKA